MYPRSDRFRRAVRVGSTSNLVLAIVTACAITLGSVSAAGAATSLYAQATHASQVRHDSNSDGPMEKTPAIVTESGPVKGVINGNVAEFLGIPYAAPPVGNLRWMPPQAYGQFPSLLDASSFGSQCTQPDGSGSENCLFLNVYVPNFKKDDNEHRRAMPVMFWIHGGGLTSGAGSDYDPTPLLAPANVIVVTINYRLGYLGFFAQTALDSEGHDAGNYGLMDQQFAMQWVHNNIAAFGGDPSNVTIFGESAGGHSVYCNLASPTAAGLFSHAISESGSYLLFDTFIQPVVPLSVGENPPPGSLVPGGDSVASGFGCTTAACLRAVSNTDLVSNEPSVLYAFVDGTLLTETPSQAFAAGTFNRVPVIAGTNHDEYRIFVADAYDLVGNPILTLMQYQEATLLLYGPMLGPIVEFFYPYMPPPPGGQVLGTSGTDGIFACSARNGDEFLSNFTTTYAYEFNDENAPPQPTPAGLTFPLGAYHGSEVQYLFDVGFFFEFTPAQKELSQAMVDYWTNFAVSGDPNGGSLPTWSPYATSVDQFQSLIPPTPVVESSGSFNTDHICDFWNAIP
ncbi:MAG: carboxylesterase family protein [Candidatus Binatus sp.]